MKTFIAFLAESFTHADIEKLRADAGAFTKNIRRIKSGQDLATVAQAFRVWTDYADNFVYKRIMGYAGAPLENESWASKELRTKWWTLVKLTEPFIAEGHIRSYGLNLRSSAGIYAYTTATASSWDQVYEVFNRKRENIYTKTSRAVREAFAALDEYLSQQNTTVYPDKGTSNVQMVDGVPVNILGSEVQSGSFDPQKVIQTIHGVLALIRRRGLGAALNRFRIDVHTVNDHVSNAGDYHIGRESVINIYFWGANPHTVAHEIGHHLWYRLSKERQQHWIDFVKRNRITFTDEDFDRLHSAYLTAFQKHANEEDGYTVSDMWERLLPQYVTDRDTLVKYRHFMIAFGKSSRRRVVLDPFADGRDVNEKWQEFKHEASVPFLLFAPSAYSNKNSDEAFAETFAEYVLQEHPLADIVRATFEEVVGLS